MSMVKDPVCGMNVDEKAAKFKSEHWAKPTTSATSRAKQCLRRTPKDSLMNIQNMKDTVAAANND